MRPKTLRFLEEQLVELSVPVLLTRQRSGVRVRWSIACPAAIRVVRSHGRELGSAYRSFRRGSRPLRLLSWAPGVRGTERRSNRRRQLPAFQAERRVGGGQGGASPPSAILVRSLYGQFPPDSGVRSPALRVATIKLAVRGGPQSFCCADAPHQCALISSAPLQTSACGSSDPAAWLEAPDSSQSR